MSDDFWERFERVSRGGTTTEVETTTVVEIGKKSFPAPLTDKSDRVRKEPSTSNSPLPRCLKEAMIVGAITGGVIGGISQMPLPASLLIGGAAGGVSATLSTRGKSPKQEAIALLEKKRDTIAQQPNRLDHLAILSRIIEEAKHE